MVQLLLENKANINAQDSFNRAPLHWSVVNPDVDCLKVYKSLKLNHHSYNQQHIKNIPKGLNNTLDIASPVRASI